VGLRLSTGAGSESERKAAQRGMIAREKAGLIEVLGYPRQFVKLTERAEFRARAMAGLPQVADSQRALKEVIRRSRNIRGAASELALAGLAKYAIGCQTVLWHVHTRLAPGLLRNWLTVSSLRTGEAFYSLTDEGRKVMRRKPLEMPADLPTVDDEARQWYLDETASAREWRIDR
jgi:hypothetical protein